MTGAPIEHLAFGDGRVTAQRSSIARTAASLLGAFTVEDLVEAVRTVDPAAGATATVYRAVSAMEVSGFLVRVGERKGSALYARCAAETHHHHIVCDGCGRIAHTECPFDVEAATAAAAEGFVVTRHEVTLYGLCPECAVDRQGA